MKKLILGLVLTLFVCGTSHAQKKRNPQERINAQTEQMAKDLNLDASQKKQVAAINKEFAAKMKEIHQNNKGNREAGHEAIKKLNAERKQKLKSILSEKQYKKHLELEKQRRKARQNHRPGGKAPNSQE